MFEFRKKSSYIKRSSNLFTPFPPSLMRRSGMLYGLSVVKTRSIFRRVFSGSGSDFGVDESDVWVSSVPIPLSLSLTASDDIAGCKLMTSSLVTYMTNKKLSQHYKEEITLNRKNCYYSSFCYHKICLNK